MGHSASIARKYQAPEAKVEEQQDDADSLATVSSFRPNTPGAHSDAHEFILEPVPSGRPMKAQSYYGYPAHALPITYRTGSLGYRPSDTYSSTTLGTTPFRSMHDVRHYLIRNPELLSGKHQKNGYKKNQFHDISEQQKQIKTKQNVYMGLLNPPYGYGVDREQDKQLKVKQKLYLQLVSPAYVNSIEYYAPAPRSRMPLRREDMVVVRKDDSLKKLAPDRSRPPLPAIKGKQHGSVEGPMRSTLRQQQPAMQVSRRDPARTPNGSIHGLSQLSPQQTSTPQGAIPKRRGNDYMDMATPGIKRSAAKSHKQKSREELPSQVDGMEVERRDKTNSLGRQKPKRKESEIIFDYDVNELGLKKNTDVAYSERPKDRGKVVPLYFRKSLAYNPQYSNGREILSGPL